MIFKVQTPIVTSESLPVALVYNEDRSIEFMLPVAQVEGWFTDDQHKIFIEADYTEKERCHEIAFKNLVEFQSW